MIYFAQFHGRQKNANGIFYPIQTHCYGDDPAAAELQLYDNWEHISRLELSPRPIVTVGDCLPGDRIYRVENGRLIGAEKPHESAYTVLEKNEIVCSGEYANHVTCQNGGGIAVPLHPSLECIVAYRTPA